MAEQPPTGQTVVLLIDFDNLQICASRDTPGMDVDLGAVMALAQSYGTVIVARAYAEWNHLNERLSTYKAGIEPAFAPVLRTEASGRNGGKSLADTVIVADGVDLLWRMSPDVLVLATSDKDLIPLVRLAKQRGTQVVVVGSDLTAVPLVEIANHFVTYRQLISDREHDKEREQGAERERMRVMREARRDEAIRAREARRQVQRVSEDERIRQPLPPAAAPEPAPAAVPTPGELALAAGADGAPAGTRRRRRRRRSGRPLEPGYEGQEQASSEELTTAEDEEPGAEATVEPTPDGAAAVLAPEEEPEPSATEAADAFAPQPVGQLVAPAEAGPEADSAQPHPDQEADEASEWTEEEPPAPRPQVRRRRTRTRKPPTTA